MRYRPFSPPGDDSASLADWAEATLYLFEDDAELSRADLARLLANEPLDDTDFEVDTGEAEVPELEEVVRDDARIDGILAVVNQRAKTAKTVYPFRIEGDVLTMADVPLD